MKTALQNVWTTTLGVAAGAATYLMTSGAKVPATREEWGWLLISALLAGMGIASKDATTGSKPGGAKP